MAMAHGSMACHIKGKWQWLRRGERCGEVAAARAPAGGAERRAAGRAVTLGEAGGEAGGRCAGEGGGVSLNSRTRLAQQRNP